VGLLREGLGGVLVIVTSQPGSSSYIRTFNLIKQVLIKTSKESIVRGDPGCQLNRERRSRKEGGWEGGRQGGRRKGKVGFFLFQGFGFPGRASITSGFQLTKEART
jgi:hypothetical protein